VGLFDQLPFVAVSVSPCPALPEITGSALFAGAGGSTTAVGIEVALADPPALLAVTVTSIVLPTSLDTAV
jgi:hypothetical protein